MKLGRLRIHFYCHWYDWWCKPVVRQLHVLRQTWIGLPFFSFWWEWK